MKCVIDRIINRYVGSIVALLMSVGMWAQSAAEELRDKADSLYNIQQYDEAKSAALEGLDCLGEGRDAATSDADEETRGDLLNLMSIINVRQGHFEQAAEYAKQCNELDLKRGDPDMISSSYNTLTAIIIYWRWVRCISSFSV